MTTAPVRRPRPSLERAHRTGVAVCVFAKPPVPGRVKTRLVARVGRRGAAAFAAVFLDDTLAAIAAQGWARPVLALAGRGEPPRGAARIDVWRQGKGDLGARLERVLRRALRRHRAAIAIGADSPDLPARFLAAARDRLTAADAVLGPCADGGFYLLGLRACPPGLLAGLPWSRSDTAARTSARLRARGLRVASLGTWEDVDRPEDLDRLAQRLAPDPRRAPRTARLLAALASSGELA